MKKENIILDKSYSFSLRIIKLYKFLCENKKEFVMSKQILRSGTSIGANVNESQAAETKNDFVHKLGIAAKEIRETEYWLKLLKDSEYLEENSFNSLIQDCEELRKIVNSIILSSKQKSALHS
ncbi:MAG: four helix bundle protein [Ignavibacteriae bacterium]|nr:four helix bundle protein [Ignavibacteriota bacterium]